VSRLERADTALQFILTHPPKLSIFWPVDGISDPSAETFSGGERHNVAILWLQLALPPTLDDELYFEMISILLPACITIAGEMGGAVKQRADGLTVAYGVPAAYENDIEQAVLTAEKMGQFLNQPDLKAEFDYTYRLILTYGSVIAGKVNAQDGSDMLLRGQPLNIAEKVANLLPSEKIWVDETVRLRAARRFQFAEEATAVDKAGEFWLLLREREAPEPARGIVEAQSRFLGRDSSLNAMRDLFKNLSQNMGAIVWIEGEAGIGKSRLMREFRQTTPNRAAVFWSGGCAPQRIEHAFSLFTDLLSPVFGLQPGDSNDEKRQKINNLVKSWPADVIPTQPYLELLVGCVLKDWLANA
jgi:class 3 adenylate cyclase